MQLSAASMSKLAKKMPQDDLRAVADARFCVDVLFWDGVFAFVIILNLQVLKAALLRPFLFLNFLFQGRMGGTLPSRFKFYCLFLTQFYHLNQCFWFSWGCLYFRSTRFSSTRHSGWNHTRSFMYISIFLRVKVRKWPKLMKFTHFFHEKLKIERFLIYPKIIFFH